MSKITHEQAREILNKIYYHCKDIPRQEDLEQYILQQERLENETIIKIEKIGE